MSVPNPAFAWVFVLALATFLIVAAVVDYRTFKIPKQITVPLALLGLPVNIVRGILLGAQDRSLFALPPGVITGAIDGLLFSLVGFVFGFVLFAVLRQAGACGGGDVKIFAGLAGWIGPVEAVRVLIASVVVVFLTVLTQVLKRPKNDAETPQSDAESSTATSPNRERLKISFSLPLCIATVVVLVFDLRDQLGLTTAF